MAEDRINSPEELRWRPYPRKTDEEFKSYAISDQELDNLSEREGDKVHKIRSEWVGKIQEHRCKLMGDFKMLKTLRGKYHKKGKSITRINEILQEHREKERNINNMSTNMPFRQTLDYTNSGNWGND